MGGRLRVERITTEGDWFEPFKIALGYRVGDVVILSGQAAIDRQGQVIGVGDFDAQAQATFENVAHVLELAGSSMRNILNVNIYLTDMSNFPKILELREKWFTPPYPADTIVEVKSLALPELMIEIQAIAVVDEAVEGA
ncbi:MAG: RidA family protein [Thermoleophilia bacterium]